MDRSFRQLSDCVLQDPSQREILLFFSEAARDSARIDRSRLAQALLSIDELFKFGDDVSEVLDDDNVKLMIAAIGVGICLPVHNPALFDITKLRYHKIIIVAEETESGNRVRDEVIRFIATYLNPLIVAGHVQVPQPSVNPGFTQEEFAQVILNPDTRRLKILTSEDL